ncbi:hypothetical protein EI94DRAFT_1710296 [Lactarius quietus]|nr:hypothetical protein EI94DRAFT_1710296 [Lactarius quietus]
MRRPNQFRSFGFQVEEPEHAGARFAPLIVALALVLNEKPDDQDFSLITDNFPQDQLGRSKYYNPLAQFPANLSSYLPPREDWWWEDLGAWLSFIYFNFLQQNTAAESHPAPTPQEPVTSEDYPMHDKPAAFDRQGSPQSAALEVPELPEVPAATQPEVPESPAASYFGEDVNMAVDELAKRCRKRKAAKTVAPAKSSKRPTPASQPQTPGSEDSDSDVDELDWESPFDVKFVCDKCATKGIVCVPHPTAACQQCHTMKMGCSLMPQDNTTSRPYQQALSAKFVFKYWLQQQQQQDQQQQQQDQQQQQQDQPQQQQDQQEWQQSTKSKLVGQKGKKNVCATEEDLPPEASGSGASPSTSLAISRMTLESESSKGNSPVLSPAPSIGSSALFSVELPIPPKRPMPRIVVPPIKSYRQPSPTALSQSSDDGQNLRARVMELEATVQELKKDVAAVKKAASHKLKGDKL